MVRYCDVDINTNGSYLREVIKLQFLGEHNTLDCQLLAVLSVELTLAVFATSALVVREEYFLVFI